MKYTNHINTPIRYDFHVMSFVYEVYRRTNIKQAIHAADKVKEITQNL